MRVAFVVQRCGLEVNGGAESLCLQIARRMAKHWEVEVLTTCALDYMTWENWYRPGAERIEEIVVKRFPVDAPRNVEAFNRLSAELHPRQNSASLPEQETWMRAQGPVSTPLCDCLSASLEEYDAFVFFGYLYATTYLGLPLVREKAYLAPLAHDEWPIYFGMWDQFFGLPKGFIFQTPEEKLFLRKRFPGLGFDGETTGIGIEAPQEIAPDDFRTQYRLSEPFLLYVGRIDAAKGCGELFDFFTRLRRTEDTPRKLVLIGGEVLPIPFHDDIIHIGFVDEPTKWNAIGACDWLLMPSQHESLSIVLLESWAVGRPAVVNGRSEVLVAHCRRSNGGLWYFNFDEWAAAVTQPDSATKSVLGRQGQRYVAANYSWERIEAAYNCAVRSPTHAGRPSERVAV